VRRCLWVVASPCSMAFPSPRVLYALFCVCKRLWRACLINQLPRCNASHISDAAPETRSHLTLQMKTQKRGGHAYNLRLGTEILTQVEVGIESDMEKLSGFF
jgi:hypothetical protein